jgi:hypothetical protein
MTILMVILFTGSIALTQFLGIVADPQETILSALSRKLFGNHGFYYLVQFATLFILAVAANTSFVGFPRVAAILARDKFLPRQLDHLGERLVLANGIVVLATITAGLIIAFKGDSHSLIPLFAVGAFLAFTLSQTGMVMHWFRTRGPSWKIKLFANGLGAVTTATALIIVSISKFMEGAWLTLLVIPSFVLIFLKINQHYQDVSKQLSLRGMPPSLRPAPPPRIVIPISGVHRGIIVAVDFARGITDQITAVYIETEEHQGEGVKELWERWFPEIPLVILSSPYRMVIGPLLDFLDNTDSENNDGQLAAVVLPEFVPARWWHSLLHNQTTWLLKTALLYRRRNQGFQRVIIDIPYHLKK